VVFVLPIRVQDRFTAALSSFLKGVDRYIEVYLKMLLEPLESIDLSAEELNIDSSYRKLELNLPNVIYEYNPLSQAQNRFASLETMIETLKSQVNNLVGNVGGEPGVLNGIKDADLTIAIQSNIRENIQALNTFLIDEQTNQALSLENSRKLVEQKIDLNEAISAFASPGEIVRNRAIYHLIRIEDTILQIAVGLGLEGA
jgi:hypothetical protein